MRHHAGHQDFHHETHGTRLFPGILGAQDKGSLLLVSLPVALSAGLFEELGWTGFCDSDAQTASWRACHWIDRGHLVQRLAPASERLGEPGRRWRAGDFRLPDCYRHRGLSWLP